MGSACGAAKAEVDGHAGRGIRSVPVTDSCVAFVKSGRPTSSKVTEHQKLSDFGFRPYVNLSLCIPMLGTMYVPTS